MLANNILMKMKQVFYSGLLLKHHQRILASLLLFTHLTKDLRQMRKGKSIYLKFNYDRLQSQLKKVMIQLLEVRQAKRL